MDQIASTTVNNYTQYQTKPNSAPKQAAESETDDKRLVLEITPGEENESDGDRSQNTIQFNVQGPNNEFSAELSREQLIEGLDNRFTRQAVEGAIGNGDNSQIAQAVALQNADEETAQALVEGRQAQSLVDTYTNTVERVSEDSNTTASQNQDQQTADAINTYNEYQQQVVKQDIFFSRVENSGLDIKA